MKYTIEMEIPLSRDKVVDLFDNPDNMKKWQKGLISFTPISGEPGQHGAKSQLKYQMGKRVVEMTETITKNDLPDEFSGTYEAKGVWNSVENYFSTIDENTTNWRLTTEFKFKGFMKIMGTLMPFMFKKQTETFMNDFKKFATGDAS